jgi:sugar phosphate isomerase/epimerase
MEIRAFANSLRNSSIALLNVEYFPLREGTNIDGYRNALELGARLGARRATTHLFDSDPARRLDGFVRLAAIAADLGLELALEFTAASRVPDLAVALALLNEAECSNAVLTIDLLQHARAGGTSGALAAADQILVGTVQLADGPAEIAPTARAHESLENRLVPGEGALPLRAYIDALPRSTQYEVEVPQAKARNVGVTGSERIARAVAGARRLLSRTAPVTPEPFTE